MGTRYKFLTTVDMVIVGDRQIRLGAVGLYDTQTGEVVFRLRDVLGNCNVNNGWGFWWGDLKDQVDKFEIDEGL